MRARFESAVSVVGNDVDWNDDEARWKRVQSLSEDKLKRIYDLEDGLFDLLGETGVKLFKYVSEHRDYFGMPDEFWTEDLQQ